MRAGRHGDALVVCDQVLACVVNSLRSGASRRRELVGGRLIILQQDQTIGSVPHQRSAGEEKRARSVGEGVAKEFSLSELRGLCVEASAWLYRSHALHGFETGGRGSRVLATVSATL